MYSKCLEQSKCPMTTAMILMVGMMGTDVASDVSTWHTAWALLDTQHPLLPPPHVA